MSAKKNYVVHVRIDIGKATMYEYCTSLNQSTETRQNYAIQIQEINSSFKLGRHL